MSPHRGPLQGQCRALLGLVGGSEAAWAPHTSETSGGPCVGCPPGSVSSVEPTASLPLH